MAFILAQLLVNNWSDKKKEIRIRTAVSSTLKKEQWKHNIYHYFYLLPLFLRCYPHMTYVSRSMVKCVWTSFGCNKDCCTLPTKMYCFVNWNSLTLLKFIPAWRIYNTVLLTANWDGWTSLTSKRFRVLYLNTDNRIKWK